MPKNFFCETNYQKNIDQHQCMVSTDVYLSVCGKSYFSFNLKPEDNISNLDELSEDRLILGVLVIILAASLTAIGN